MVESIPLWLLITLATMSLFIIILTIASLILHRKLRSFTSGKDGASLESSIEWLTKKNFEVDQTLNAHKEALEIIDSRIKKSIRGYSLVRYDAYEDNGGNQSFASALIDESGDGFILSVITNRNHVGVYAKPVSRGNPLPTLTPEEEDALETSKKSLHI
ncbi:DUF4446 family protein [Candidatus Nomurabacteria bacterium]|nr:DUF4446 family protein [Candidatus Nomurabacteria bacterium]